MPDQPTQRFHQRRVRCHEFANVVPWDRILESMREDRGDSVSSDTDSIDFGIPDEEPEQAWREHLRNERDWKCPYHGFVRSGGRQHGGRARAHKCPHCSSTLKNTTVDWDAYRSALDSGENPPCPQCGSANVGTIPAKPKYHCEQCSHQFGQAGAYY